MDPLTDRPCPCGSGRRLIQCCGQAIEMPPAHRVVHQHWPATHALPIHWAVDRYGGGVVRGAMSEFARPEEPHVWPSGAFMPLVESWFIYDWRPEDSDETVATGWLRQLSESPLADEPVVQIVRAGNESPLTFYQVERLQPGRGVFLRDLLLDRTIFVDDQSFSLSAKRHYIMFGRLISCMGVTIIDAMGPLPLDPTWRSKLLDELEQDHENLPWQPADLRQAGTELFTLFDEALDRSLERWRAPRRLANTDGHPMVNCRVRLAFDATDRVAIFERLVDIGWAATELEELQDPDRDLPEDTISLFMTDPNLALLPGGEVSVGTVLLHRDTLELTTNSRERRDRLLPTLESELAPLVRRLDDDEKDISEIAQWSPTEGWLDASKVLEEKLGMKPGERKALRAPPPEVEAAMQQALEEFIDRAERGWVDESIPALGGMTPREAMRTEHGKRELEDLLRTFEQDDERSASVRHSGAMNANRLRRLLGLPVSSD